MMKDMHGLECQQCKRRNAFYETFNSDSKKNVSYFGIISYMVLYPDESKKEFPENGQNYMGSNICFLQLINEWSIRELISKRLKKKKELLPTDLEEKDELFFSRHLKVEKRNVGPKTSFYLPDDTGNLITIKKSEPFSASSPADSVCSDNVKTTNIVYKCHVPKKSPSKEKVAPKEPKIGTLKRKRWNWEKLKTKETYEDDLFEEKKLKRIQIDDSSEEDKIATPVWSVQISPRKLSRSPSYEDCYSLTELQNSRKEAEEYQHRRNKKKKYTNVYKKDDPETIMKQDPKTYQTLKESCNRLKKIKELRDKREADDDDADTEKDHYFSDLEDSDD